ncbi:MAG: hypothetical protein KAS66_06340 [Candidatus Omnitrophica bacterium]|nr:hypothetical protein [Candidatus Omnitrophota bacterium]
MSEYICPNCKKPIYDPDALLCHFCGGSLSRAGKGFLGRVRYSNQKVVWFFITFAVLLAFILLFVR